MSTQLIGSNMRELIYPGDGLARETFAWWMSMVAAQALPLWSYLRNLASGGRRRRAALRRLPLGTLDQAIIGTPSRFWRAWIAHEQPDDSWWDPGDHRASIGGVRAPNHLVGGWHDFFLPSLLCDYRAMVEAGRRPYLTVGPWLHTDVAALMTGMREALIWLRAHLLGDRTGLRQLPVRIFVQGANTWRDLPAWPPETMRPQRWYLQPRRAFAPVAPPACEPDGLRYDPRDPTPSTGDVGRFVVRGTARRDNRALEARPDVLISSSTPLDRDTELLGPVSAELWIRSSHEHCDLFVRICDVDASGRSLNICDGLLRLAPGRPQADADGCCRVCIDLWPTAYHLRRGHRLRVQIAGGSFPRWSRNLSGGEPSATATTAHRVAHSIDHDPHHPSSIALPIAAP